jgi:hypothetical protein
VTVWGPNRSSKRPRHVIEDSREVCSTDQSRLPPLRHALDGPRMCVRVYPCGSCLGACWAYCMCVCGVVLAPRLQGWVESVRYLINAYFLQLPLAEYDYSRIRPAGTYAGGYVWPQWGPATSRRRLGVDLTYGYHQVFWITSLGRIARADWPS